jgi:hypothetical protein
MLSDKMHPKKKKIFQDKDCLLYTGGTLCRKEFFFE